MKSEARYYNQSEGHVTCLLCPHGCRLKDGQSGLCNNRYNNKGILFTNNYGEVVSLNIDPIEKKPLYHFHPGGEILSIGGFGCNFTCLFCQNHHISQAEIQDQYREKTSPEKIVAKAIELQPKAGIAFTYNEPLINFEFITDTLTLAKMQNIATVLISNGYVNPSPLKQLLEITDAFNIDLKGFDNEFYEKFTGGKLHPVLKTIETIAKSGKHLEITHLLVTEANDNSKDFTNMCRWIADHAGKQVPLHVSRYFPNYHYGAQATNTDILDQFLNIATQHLDFVYAGNYKAQTDTICPACGTKIIERNGYNVKTIGLNGKNCLNCRIELPIIL